MAMAFPRWIVPVAWGVLLMACGCTRSEAPAAPASADPAAVAAHRADVEAWQRKREAALREPAGWLTLAGLFWLEEGANGVGSDPSLPVVLPLPVPERLGVIQVVGSSAYFTLTAHDAGAVVEGGEPLPPTLALGDDESREGPTVITVGPVRFFVIRRSGKLAVRVTDANSKVLSSFRGIERFPIDYGWRIEARFEAQPEEIEVPSVLGGTTTERAAGWLIFDKDGATHKLRALDEDGRLFVVFADETNRKETYGAGRFLYADRPIEGDRVVLDFNRAYNPPCAFTPYATCPLPPKGNVLALRVTAGEKRYGDH